MNTDNPPEVTDSSLLSPDSIDFLGAREEVIGYVRSPRDVLRVVAFGVTAVIVALTTRYLRDSLDTIEIDLSELLELPWDRAQLLLDGTLVAMTSVVGLAILVVPLVMRRWRLFGYVVAANIVAGGAIALLNAWITSEELTSSATGSGTVELARSVGVDAAGATQLIAAFIVIAPFVARKWRRAGVVLVAVMLVMRLVVVSGESTHALLVITVGGFVGSLVLVAFGRPVSRPTMGAIQFELWSNGLDVAELEPASVDARGSVPYFVTLEDGGKVFAKVMGAEERAADLLFRLYRWLRLKNVGDERPFSSLRRTVEHEALVSLRARDVGVLTPRLRTVNPVGLDSYLLAYDMIDGSSLDSVETDRITDEVLRSLWSQIAILRHNGIGHRDLRLANVFLDESSQPWIIDFGFSELAAQQGTLDADVAQLLTSLALTVGCERATTTAVEVLGTEAVASCLPRLQPSALSGATQSALKEQKGLLDQLREEVTAETGTEVPPLEPLTRFTGRQVFALVMAVAVIYFLVPQLADLPGIVQQVSGANWWWVIPILVASVGTYAFAALSLMGSIPGRLSYGPTFAAQVASSFASKVAPAGLGGMALNVRYLQRTGTDGAVATAGVGLNAVAGIIGHIALIVAFIGWAGRDAFGDISLPSPEAFLIGIAVVAVITALAMLVPRTRRLVTEQLFPIIAKSTRGLAAVLRSPAKLVLLLGGSTLVTLSYAIGFFFAGKAFGLDERFAVVAAVYLVGAAVATAAPTPGGLGAVEAALIAGLVAAGIDKEIAVPTVFLYRLATFWFPILPGWGAFTWLRRTDRL